MSLSILLLSPPHHHDTQLAALQGQRLEVGEVLIVDQTGSGLAFNRAIGAARGTVLCFVSDGCIPEPDWTETITRAFTEHEDLGCLQGVIIGEDLRPALDLRNLAIRADLFRGWLFDGRLTGAVERRLRRRLRREGLTARRLDEVRVQPARDGIRRQLAPWQRVRMQLVRFERLFKREAPL